MKVLKVILLLAVILFGAWLVMCAMAPDSIKTSRSITIDAPAEQVYPWVADLNAWKAWSPWQNKDSTMVNTVTTPSIGEGAKMTWTSEEMGAGSMEITSVVPNEKIKTKLLFEGYDSESYADFNFAEANGATTVEWSMNGGEVAYLFRGFLMLMNAIEMINADYDEGLLALKQKVESMPEPVIIEDVNLELDGIGADSTRVDSIPLPQ